MPNRMLRDWTDSEKVNSLNAYAERFFTRLIMKVDDYGCFYANTSLLKASLFPLLLDSVREADITRWMAECHKAGLIVLYEANGKKYLQILDFRQRLDKAKAKFPLPPLELIDSLNVVNDFPETGNDFPPEAEVEVEKKKNRAKALVGASPDVSAGLQIEYKNLVDSLAGKERKNIWAALKEFILKNNPGFIDPYVDAWNVFASNYKLALVEAISESRKKKFKTRLQEDAFDFLKILERIKLSPHLKGDNNGSWKVTFDWVFENDKNYVKIIEGNYN